MTSYAGREGARYAQAAEKLTGQAVNEGGMTDAQRQLLVSAADVNARLAQAMATLALAHEEKQQQWGAAGDKLKAAAPEAATYMGESWKPGDCVRDNRGHQYIRTANVAQPWTGHTGLALIDEIPMRPLRPLWAR